MPARLVQLETAPDLVERVHRALVDAISDGSLAPGERVTQEDIAERLKVSRQPVLQAMRLLRQDGLLEDAPGRGLRVALLEPAALQQVYQVRGALDALAARLAAQRRATLDPALIEHGRRCARGGDVAAMVEADQAFHHAVYAASGNPLIERSARLHWCHVRRAMGAVLQNHHQRTPVWAEHEAIARAIGAGRADEAEALMTRHAHQASDTLARRLQHLLDPANPLPHTETPHETHA